MKKYVITIKSNIDVLNLEDELENLTEISFGGLNSFKNKLYNIGIKDGEFIIYTLKEFEQAWNSTDDDLECLNILDNYLKIINVKN